MNHSEGGILPRPGVRGEKGSSSWGYGHPGSRACSIIGMGTPMRGPGAQSGFALQGPGMVLGLSQHSNSTEVWLNASANR